VLCPERREKERKKERGRTGREPGEKRKEKGGRGERERGGKARTIYFYLFYPLPLFIWEEAVGRKGKRKKKRRKKLRSTRLREGSSSSSLSAFVFPLP